MPITTTTAEATHAQSPPLNRKRRRIVIALVVLAILAIVAVVLARGAAHWLVRPDPLVHADVIVTLSGGLPFRAEGTADIYQQGYAPLVWVSRPAGPQGDLAQLGIHYIGEEEYNREAIVHRGVPESAVQILPEEIENTEQEIEEITRLMRRDGKRTVIIVTSPEHTRRVRALWKRLAGNDLTLIVRGADEDPIDLDHWWRNTRDVFSVVREYLGLANIWLGLPVRPHAPGA
jgi:uncharacterized SAM-binding protein YcdF (DUF218 family)